MSSRQTTPEIDRRSAECKALIKDCFDAKFKPGEDGPSIGSAFVKTILEDKNRDLRLYTQYIPPGQTGREEDNWTSDQRSEVKNILLSLAEHGAGYAYFEPGAPNLGYVFATEISMDDHGDQVWNFERIEDLGLAPPANTAEPVSVQLGASTNGITDGMTNGMTNDMRNGITHGMTNDITNDMRNGMTNGMTHGMTNGGRIGRRNA